MKHSSKVRAGLHSHLRQSPKENAQSNNNVQFILAAEFDNKTGPIIKHLYPKTIPGFKSVGNDATCSHLASLMIPNSIENHPGKPDFTVFVLYKNRNVYQLFPVSKNEADGTLPDPSLIIEEESFEEEQEIKLRNGKHTSSNANAQSETAEPPMFFLNVVNTFLDQSNDRGAYIKAIALGTTLTNFYIFKPLLTMVLDYYMKSNKNDIKILIDCFNMINSLDLSLVNKFHSNIVLQNILNSLNDEDITSRIFDSNNNSLPNILRVNKLPKRDGFGNEIQFKNRILEYQFSTFCPKILPSYFTKIPLQIDLVKYDKIKVDTSYNHLILKLLSRLIPPLTELSDSEYSWRLIINSTQSSKDELCQFVLALSNLINGFSSDYFDSSSICIFPYMEISVIDLFREKFKDELRKGNFFSVVGVSNPIFQYQVDIWDFYYDLDTDSLLTSKPLSQQEANVEKNQGLRSMFNRYTNSHAQSPSTPKMFAKKGLMSHTIDLLVKGQHDNETVLNTLKRASILQLLHLVKSDHKSVTEIEIILKDQYTLNYKDLILFPVIFEYNSLKVLNIFHTLELTISKLLWPSSNHTTQTRRRTLQELYKNLKDLYKFVALNKKNLGKFLSIAMNYPLVSAFESLDVANSHLQNLDLEKLLSNERLNMNSIDSLYDGNTPGNAIDHFNTYKSFNLLLFPLFLNPQKEQDDANYLAEMGPPSVSTRLSTSKNYNYQLDSNLSVMSSVYETNELMSHDYNYESTVHEDALTIFSARSTVSDLSSLVNKCKQMSIKILYRIQRHHIGSLLFNLKLNPLLRVTYQTSKKELFSTPDVKPPTSSLFSPASKLSPADPVNSKTKFRKPSPSGQNHESSMKLSVSRRELLKDLNSINVKKEVAPVEHLENPASPKHLLESLSRFQISPNRSENF
ncbi:unnamed protein product [Kluyveromyces dobzhanskii CBS 2104]|uniref:WGS project CCBQ000000000 data, contig 00106 n=1 Tax=Kluyveromyces dobzhanskii CBS 2104 TaxID=1427455 RepID=A0A0A8L7W4_9SACH|nr:unnamed protein product [Kluyveromyces dobzhanskii CBS 2104]